MSLMQLKRRLEKFGPWVVAVVGGLMLIGVVLSGLGGNVSGVSAPTQKRQADEPAVALVGGTPVQRSTLDRKVDEMGRMGGRQPGPDQIDSARLMVLEQLKDQEAMVAAAKQAGVTVAENEIEAGRNKLWDEQARAGFASRLGLSATATDSQIDAALAKENPGLTVDILKRNAIPDEMVRVRLAYDGLSAKLRGTVQGNEQTARQAQMEIQVRHILIKSGKDGLPDAQAKAKAEKILAELQAHPERMAALAAQWSDDAPSKAKGGLYDWQPAKTYVPEFWQGAFAAGIGKINPAPVKTTYGYHLIKLEGMRPGKNFPKDFDKEKQRYIDEYVDQQVQSKVMAAVDAAKPGVAIDLKDPGLRAAQLERDAFGLTGQAQETKLAEALAELGKIRKADDPAGAVPLRKGRIYDQLKKYKEAVAAYEEAVRFGERPEKRLALAEDYLKMGDKTKAAEQLAALEKMAVPDIPQMYQMATLYGKVGDKAKQRATEEKAQAMMKRQIEQMRAQQAALQPPTVPPSRADAKAPAPGAPRKP